MVDNDLERSTTQVGIVSLNSVHYCQHLTLDINVSRLTLVQCLRTEGYRSSLLDIRRNSSGDRRPTSTVRLSSRALVECTLSLQSLG